MHPLITAFSLVLLALFRITSAAPGVKIVLYAESLCPYCEAFIHESTSLEPLLALEGVEFSVVAWGNAINVTQVSQSDQTLCFLPSCTAFHLLR
jgi:hypothetical protein